MGGNTTTKDITAERWREPAHKRSRITTDATGMDFISCTAGPRNSRITIRRQDSAPRKIPRIKALVNPTAIRSQE